MKDWATLATEIINKGVNTDTECLEAELLIGALREKGKHGESKGSINDLKQASELKKVVNKYKATQQALRLAKLQKPEDQLVRFKRGETRLNEYLTEMDGLTARLDDLSPVVQKPKKSDGHSGESERVKAAKTPLEPIAEGGETPAKKATPTTKAADVSMKQAEEALKNVRDAYKALFANRDLILNAPNVEGTKVKDALNRWGTLGRWVSRRTGVKQHLTRLEELMKISEKKPTLENAKEAIELLAHGFDFFKHPAKMYLARDDEGDMGKVFKLMENLRAAVNAAKKVKELATKVMAATKVARPSRP